MKLNKTMGALALGFGLASAVHAQPDPDSFAIYITGSTAFRSQIFVALNSDMGLTPNGAAGDNSFTFLGGESDPHGLGFQDVGTPFGVYCNFSGSAEGCAALLGIAPYNTARYLNPTGAGSFSSTGVDLAFSDVDQNSTPYAWDTGAYAELPEIQDPHAGYPYTGVAVVTFTFAANKPAVAAGISNIAGGTMQQDFIAMFQSAPGYRDQSFFTGVAAGTAPPVVAVGRYNLSGTRITAILDDGGLVGNAAYQYALGTVGAENPTPGLHNGDSSTPSGNAWISVGNDGYFSGGNVGLALNASGSLTPAIGYIAWSDAQGKFTAGGGATPISWNGQQAYVGAFPTSAGGHWNLAGVENGSYQFWSYERLYENPVDANGSSIANEFGPDLVLALEYEIVHSVPQTAVLESQMNVYRNQDGGQILSFITAVAP